MKIKRFLAPDIRQALQQVKEVLGADAVILSNRKTEQGVEIIATCDFDLETVAAAKPTPRAPTPATSSKPAPMPRPAFSARSYSAVAEFTGTAKPVKEEPKEPRTQAAASLRPAPEPSQSAESLALLQRELQEMRRLLDRHLARESQREAPARLDLLRALNELGFARSVALELARQVNAQEDLAGALRQVQAVLTTQVRVSDLDLDRGGIIALVGPTGVGKTTTIAKLAARFRLAHGPRHLALLTTDNYRIAAYEQLSTYARILGVPIRAVANADELRTVLQGFQDKRLILIDTAGMSPRDLRLAEHLALLRDGEAPIRTYLVLSAGAQLPSLNEAIGAFSGCRPKAAILTKLDEAGSLGPALSALIQQRLPVACFTDGQQVPEDLHAAQAQALVQRCFAMTPPALAEEEFDFEEWIAHAHA
ncbi:flagellar biosynthesis protein FlhF [Methylothermus subterraneus]